MAEVKPFQLVIDEHIEQQLPADHPCAVLLGGVEGSRVNACGRVGDADVMLRFNDEEQRLEIHFLKKFAELGSQPAPLFLNFTHLDITTSFGRSFKQPLAKAVGLKKGMEKPRVLDATAGLGEDAFLMAALGCTVYCVERHPLVHLLLTEVLHRTSGYMDPYPEIVERMSLSGGDAVSEMQRMIDAGSDDYDAVYLDPMYPEKKRHKSARTRKPIWFLRNLLAGETADDEQILFEAALELACKRVVVKRPNHAPVLQAEGYAKPAVSHKAKNFRFDVYPRK
ncbi:class I SAM-dependent methyltransferase [Poriferisphaera sp. WC338]|uniref:class I SAM-dependent methyltransferase n=1 Tax=Poriferisphaera sp. WC338 TaxID=3425129 RepID=UPI003D819F4C